MFCTKCGSELGDGDKFCAQCGTPVGQGGNDVPAESRGDVATSGNEAPVTDGGGAEGSGMTDADIAGAVLDASAEETTPLRLEIPNEEDDRKATQEATEEVTAEVTEEVPSASQVPVTPSPSPQPTDGQPAPTMGMPVPQPQQTGPTSPHDAAYGTPYGYGASQPTGSGTGVPNGTGPQAPAQRVPWYMTVPGRIAMGAVGVILIISGISKMVGACTPSGGDPKPPIEKTDTTGKPSDDTSDPSGGRDERKDGKTDGKDDGTGKPSDGDHDVIIADDDDIVIADDGDIVIRDKKGDSDDVDYGGGEKFDSWAEECTDKDGNPTVYAISELKGWQLETLCQEKGLKWDDQMLEWDGKNGYALVVYDKDHKRIDDEAIAKLGKATDNDGVVYEIQSEGNNEVEDAYKAFVEDVMVSEDSETMTDKMLVGVAYGPSMSRVFVPVYKGSVVPYSMTQVFSEKAIKAGVYDKFNDPSQAYPERDTYGDTAPKVFESVTGRKLGSNH